MLSTGVFTDDVNKCFHKCFPQVSSQMMSTNVSTSVFADVVKNLLQKIRCKKNVAKPDATNAKAYLLEKSVAENLCVQNIKKLQKHMQKNAKEHLLEKSVAEDLCAKHLFEKSVCKTSARTGTKASTETAQQ